MGTKILIIDDEAPIRKLLRVTLEAHGYTIIEAATGQAGIVETGMQKPELILLDLGLPDIDGLDILQQLRSFTTTPILVLTVQEDEMTKVSALDYGADDYITKPFSIKELLARLRVALRHAVPFVIEPQLTFGAITLDLSLRQVTREQEIIKLTPIEYDLFRLLAVHAGKVLTHRFLLQEVWGYHHDETAQHYLRVYIGHLRKKIEMDAAKPQLILTEPGIGYRLMPPATE